MNYTKTYHLPQWKPEDRILMADFNNAMASIEKGLAAADKAGFLADEMSRDLYRQIVQCRVHHGHGGRTNAMWVNSLTTLEDAGGEGHGWGGQYGVNFGNAGLPTVEGIKAREPKEEKSINTITPNGIDELQASVTFTSDGYGMLDTLDLYFNYNGHYGTGGTLTYTIALIRLDTGEKVGETAPVTRTIPATGIKFIMEPVHFPLDPDVTYRLVYEASDCASYRGWSGIVLASSSYSDPNHAEMTFKPRTSDPAISKTVEPPAWATSAVGIIRWWGEGSLQLLVNGQPLTETRCRESVNALGSVCWETELLLEHIPEGAMTIKLVTECGGDFLSIYDYGLIWR